jgi:Domain of unknown function (DUF929)
MTQPSSSQGKPKPKKSTPTPSIRQQTPESTTIRHAPTKPSSTKPSSAKPTSPATKAASRSSSPPSSISKQTRQQPETALQRSQKQRQNQKRKPSKSSNRGLWLSVGGTVVAVAAIIVLFIFLGHNGSTTSGAYPTTPTDPTVIQEVTSVSPSVLASVGTGQNQIKPTKLNGASPLTGPSGKPEVFYYGAEFCPYCAAQRWAMIVALSRFGTFSHLSQIMSSSSDIYPNTNTFSFYKSTYTSPYLEFVPLEVESYSGTSLETPSSSQQQLVNQYNPGQSFPFLDIANQYTVIGASYNNPQILSNMSWQQIAAALSNSQSPIAQSILGSANYLTAAMCKATNQQPASVCTAAPIPTVMQSLGAAAGNSNIAGTPSLAPAAFFDSPAQRRNK